MKQISLKDIEKEVLRISDMKELDESNRRGVIMLSCAAIGPNISKLRKFTKYDSSFIKDTLEKMRKNNILTKNNKLLVEWFEEAGSVAFICDLLALEGLVKRKFVKK